MTLIRNVAIKHKSNFLAMFRSMLLSIELMGPKYYMFYRVSQAQNAVVTSSIILGPEPNLIKRVIKKKIILGKCDC